MTFDVCLITHGSKKQLSACVGELALAAQNASATVNLYLIGNTTTHRTDDAVHCLLEQYAFAFGLCQFLLQPENRSSSALYNLTASAGTGENLFFCDDNTLLSPHALKELSNAIRQEGDLFAAFAPRQLPHEQLQCYDPATLETAYVSGACLAVKRDAFVAIGGFDEQVSLGHAAVELSIHLRLKGFHIRYVPSATICRDSDATPEEAALQKADALLNNLYLRYKYGTKDDIATWDLLRAFMCTQMVQTPDGEDFPHVVAEALPAMRAQNKKQRAFYRREVKGTGFTVDWQGTDYTFMRAGDAFETRPVKENTRFSILVRAYNRPESLARTLRSLCNQTYHNFEVILVEDGENPICETVAQEAANTLSLVYLPLRRQAGRCAAGNEALARACGDYCVFLDDDDFFFADHLEALAQCISANPACEMVSMGSIEAHTLCTQDGEVIVCRMRNRMEQNFSLAKQCIDNFFPIQSIAFARILYTQYGGFDEDFHLLEDWDLWTRYACHASVYLGQKVTSVYHVPENVQDRDQRASAMGVYYAQLMQKWSRYPLPALYACDILDASGLVESKRQLAIDHNELQSLRKTACEIVQSRRWRYTAPLRAIPTFLDTVTGLQISKIHDWRQRVNPQIPDFDTADYNTLRRLIDAIRMSWCWRVTHHKKKW